MIGPLYVYKPYLMFRYLTIDKVTYFKIGVRPKMNRMPAITIDF